MALCVSAVTASSSYRLLNHVASVESCTRLSSFNCAIRGRNVRGGCVVRCVKSSEVAGGRRSYDEEEFVDMNRGLREEGNSGYEVVNGSVNGGSGAELREGGEDCEREVVGTGEGFEEGEGDGEENDYWERNEVGSSSDTTVIFPQATQKVEEDLLKRIRYQHGREVC